MARTNHGQEATVKWLLRHRVAHINNLPTFELLRGGEQLDLPSFNLASSFFFRAKFVSASVFHLFSTTYHQSDDLTISSLLTYLNAAIPLDKFEDFDTTEVVKAATLMRERGDASFKGDVLRLNA